MSVGRTAAGAEVVEGGITVGERGVPPLDAGTGAPGVAEAGVHGVAATDGVVGALPRHEARRSVHGVIEAGTERGRRKERR